MTRRGAAALLLALLAGCASPTPALFTLAAVPGPVRRIPARSIELRRIGLAGYLDRPEIVSGEADYRLHLTRNDRWGEALGTMLGRVITEDLVERLPATAVFSESGAISTRPDLVLEIDVQHFDTDTSGTLVLLAQVAVRRSDARDVAHARTLRLTSRPASPATRDLVAAMSVALGRLTDGIVAMLAHA